MDCVHHCYCGIAAMSVQHARKLQAAATNGKNQLKDSMQKYARYAAKLYTHTSRPTANR